MAKAILAGGTPADQRIVFGETGKFVFSKSMLEKFKVRLPASIEKESSLGD